MLKKYFGDRQFYKMVLAVAVPIMVQNAITNFVSLLDNIMVGQLGTAQMSSVAIVNQLIFVFNLCIFGGLSGAGIFTAQYFGNQDREGVQNTFRYKLWMGIILTVGALLLLSMGNEPLINAYLHNSNDGTDLSTALFYGKQYLWIMLAGLPPFMLAQVYASSLRECGETVAPMRAGVAAVFVNLIFNYLLIYGHFGFPEMGVQGAALATSLSRYVEMVLVIGWAHRNREKVSWLPGAYRTMRIPMEQVKQYFIKGFPLLLNEALWSLGLALLLQCYSVRGIDVVAGMNISNTICNLFNAVFISLGSAISIIAGQMMGAGKLKEAKETDTRMIVFSICCGLGIGIVVALGSSVFPLFYNVSEASRAMASRFILIAALYMPVNSFLNAAYFTLRSGGKTVITFLFDCGFTICVNLPIAWVISRYTTLAPALMYLLVESSNLIKCVIGYVLVKKDVWLQNLVSE